MLLVTRSTVPVGGASEYSVLRIDLVLRASPHLTPRGTEIRSVS